MKLEEKDEVSSFNLETKLRAMIKMLVRPLMAELDEQGKRIDDI